MGARAARAIDRILLRETGQDGVVARADRRGERAPEPDLGREEADRAHSRATQPARQQAVEEIVADQQRGLGAALPDGARQAAKGAGERRNRREGLGEADAAQVVGLAQDLDAGRGEPAAADAEELGARRARAHRRGDEGSGDIAGDLAGTEQDAHR